LEFGPQSRIFAILKFYKQQRPQPTATSAAPNKRKMYLDKTKRSEIYTQFGQNAQDSGTAESQIAQFSFRIAHLTEHLKKNKKDYSTQLSLVKMVGKRRDLLNYLKQIDIARYRAVIEKLNLRR
jgi:small subunit ribosomal protein S15